MQKSIYNTILILISISLSIQAQTYGKLYSKDEANKVYGPAIQSLNISTSELKQIINMSPNVIMFQIINKDILILGGSRNLIYSSGSVSFQESEVFHMYSTSMVKELLESGKAEYTTIEKREQVLTITNGEVTLEFSVDCPPRCEQ